MVVPVSLIRAQSYNQEALRQKLIDVLQAPLHSLD